MIRLYLSTRDTADESERWVGPLALALLQGHLICLLGSVFVGIAYQPFIFMMLALEIGLSTYIRRKRREAASTPIFAANHLRNA